VRVSWGRAPSGNIFRSTNSWGLGRFVKKAVKKAIIPLLSFFTGWGGVGASLTLVSGVVVLVVVIVVVVLVVGSVVVAVVLVVVGGGWDNLGGVLLVVAVGVVVVIGVIVG